MDALYALGEAAVSQVRAALPDPPTYSAIRTMLGRLEQKGYVSHRQSGRRYLYQPRLSRKRASRSALDRLIRTFFDGSPLETVAAILDSSTDELSAEEWDRLEEIVERGRREKR
jgi:predicted transcriptional regulator